MTFFLICRVFRFNVVSLALAYMLTTLIPITLSFASHGGNGYRWQSLPLALAVVLPLLIGWVVHRLQPDVLDQKRAEPALEETEPDHALKTTAL